MSYDEGLAQRIREALQERQDITEKKMFGGIAFMLGGNMCAGVVDDELMARVGPDQYQEALRRPHAREMDFTGRPLKGFIYVEAAGIETDRDLQQWLALACDFAGSLPAK